MNISDVHTSLSPHNVSSQSSADVASDIIATVQHLGFNSVDFPLISECHTDITLSVATGVSPPCTSSTSRERNKSWLLNYSVLSFLMNGQLFAEYYRISNMLGLPQCSDTQ